MYKVLFGALFFVLFLRVFVFEIGQVNGRSMERLLVDGEYFVVDKLTLLFRKPERGDVIQFMDRESRKFKIKRVIGLPGEIVNIESNKVYIINGEEKYELKEDYLNPYTVTISASKQAEMYQVIPGGAYFLLGDNRENSIDSRNYGVVRRFDAIGLVHLLN